VLTRERTRRFGSPPAASAPLVLTPAAGGNSVVYRDGEGYLVELWDVPGSAGAGRLAGRDVAPAAVGSPSGFVGPDGTAVVLFRGDDSHIHSLYWAGTASAGHDALSQSCESIRSGRRPQRLCPGAASPTSSIAAADGHIEELWWPGAEAVRHGHITGYCDEPLAAGDPQGYPVTTTGPERRRLPRASTVTSTRSIGRMARPGMTTCPATADRRWPSGDPVGYHLPHLDAHQVVYRAADDGHLHEIGWAGAARGKRMGRRRSGRRTPCCCRPGLLVRPRERHQARLVCRSRRSRPRPRLAAWEPRHRPGPTSLSARWPRRQPPTT
jgi:hypothetical protein